MADNSSSRDAVVIERSFDAPVDLIWQMWTDPEHFAEWYGPDGATIPVAKMDVRVGGTRLVSMEMQTPNGAMQMWFTGEYLEVVENERLVYTESMSDPNGNVIWPSDMDAGRASHDDRGPRRTRGPRWAHQDGHDPRRYSERLPRRYGMDDGLRQTRRLRQRAPRSIAKVNPHSPQSRTARHRHPASIPAAVAVRPCSRTVARRS